MPAKAYEPTPEQLFEMGSVSDREMSRRHGFSPQLWGKIRRRYDVPHFRPPTVIKGKPNKWAEKKVATGKVSNRWSPSPIPSKDGSLQGRAADYLRSKRLVCFNREKIGVGYGWQVGGRVMTQAGIVELAKSKGFEPHPYTSGY